MDDLVDQDDAGESGDEKKKKKKGESTGITRDKPVISEAAMNDLKERGFSLNQIRDILKNWKHLSPRDVALRLAEFGRDMTRASAHAVVSFTRNGGHALLTDFLKSGQRIASLYKKMTPESKKQMQKNRDFDLG